MTACEFVMRLIYHPLDKVNCERRRSTLILVYPKEILNVARGSPDRRVRDSQHEHLHIFDELYQTSDNVDVNLPIANDATLVDVFSARLELRLN